MKIVWQDGPGDPGLLYLKDIPSPALRPGHVRVRVRATAINRADLLQRRGLYPPPPGESPVMGLELAGDVIETATDVAGVQIGDRICALVPGGGYSEEAVVPAELAAKLPDPLSYETGAAIPEVFMTAYSNLVWLGQVRAGDRVLIHAGASGVGTAAIQIARELGARVAVTAGSGEKRAACLQLGAEYAIDYKSQPFADAVQEWSEGQGANVIMDFIGAPYFQANLESLATDGKLIVVGTMGGAEVDRVDLRRLLRRRLQVIGTVLRSRPLEQKAALTQELTAFLWPRLLDGRVRVVIDRVFPLAAVADAHRYMEKNLNIGKIVLSIP